MGIRRIGRHLIEHRWRLRRIFPPAALARIEQAIKAGEAAHSGQVRFVVEGATQRHGHGSTRSPVIGAFGQLEHRVMGERLPHASSIEAGERGVQGGVGKEFEQ